MMFAAEKKTRNRNKTLIIISRYSQLFINNGNIAVMCEILKTRSERCVFC